MSSSRPARRSPNPSRGLRRRLWGAGPWLLAGLLAALLLPGCPLFPENGCFVDGDCAAGYACEARTGQCVAAPRPARVCGAPDECGFNETCSRRGLCVPGDCTFSGCVAGYRCDRPEGFWTCVTEGQGHGGAGGATTAPGHAGGS